VGPLLRLWGVGGPISGKFCNQLGSIVGGWAHKQQAERPAGALRC